MSHPNLHLLKAPAEFQIRQWIERHRMEFRGHLKNFEMNKSRLSLAESFRLARLIEQAEHLLADFRTQKMLLNSGRAVLERSFDLRPSDVGCESNTARPVLSEVHR